MNKKKVMGIVAILIIAVIGCVLIAYGFNVFRSPKNITITTIDTLSKDLFSGLNQEGTIESFYDFMENTDKIRMQADLDITLDEKLGLGFSQIGLDMDYTENKEAQKSSVDMTYALDAQNMALSMIFADNKAYMMVKDAFQRYYYEDQEFQSFFANVEYVNYDIFRELFIESLKNSLKDDDFASEKTTITVNGEEVKVTKNSVPLDSAHTTAILEEFYKQIQNNEEAMNILVDVSGETKEDIIASMNDQITAEKENLTDDNTTESFPTLSVYIKGFNEVLLTELGDEDLKFQYYTYEKTREFSIVQTSVVEDELDDYYYDDYEYDYNYDHDYDYYSDYSVTTTANESGTTETSTITLKFVAIDDNTTEITVTSDGTTIVSGTITGSGAEKTLDLNVTIQSLTFKLTGTVLSEEVSANSEYHTKLDLTATMTLDEEYTFHFLMDATFSIGEEVDTSVVADALPMEEMTEEDVMALYNIPLIGSLLESYTYSNATINDSSLTTDLFA